MIEMEETKLVGRWINLMGGGEEEKLKENGSTKSKHCNARRWKARGREAKRRRGQWGRLDIKRFQQRKQNLKKNGIEKKEKRKKER